MNSIEIMSNMNSLIDENSDLYWESLMTTDFSILSLMLPLKDSEEILIFLDCPIIALDG